MCCISCNASFSMASNYPIKDTQCTEQSLTVSPWLVFDYKSIGCIYRFCSRVQYVWLPAERDIKTEDLEEDGNGLGCICVTKYSIMVAFSNACLSSAGHAGGLFPHQEWGVVCLLYSPLFCTSVLTQASLPLSPSVSSTSPSPSDISALFLSPSLTFLQHILPFGSLLPLLPFVYSLNPW